MVNVAILGFGTVGSGVADVLTRNSAVIDQRVDGLVRLKYILDVRDFPDSPYKDLFVKDFSVIENDPEVDVVVETIGGAKGGPGLHPAGPEGGQERGVIQQGAGGHPRL